jgi:hypothetical protein
LCFLALQKKNSAMAEGKALEWALGLRNAVSGKYLTQETFGFAMNVNGESAQA